MKSTLQLLKAICLLSLIIISNKIYSQAGTLDVSFGNGGKVISDFGQNDFGQKVALQSDGKIIVCGGLQENNQPSDFLAVRYNTDGTLDTTFGNNGKTTIDFNGNADFANSLAIQPNGKIVVAGTTTNNNNDAAFAISRLNKNGQIDTSFAGTGKIVEDFEGRNTYSGAVALTASGKIIISGTSIDDNGNAIAIVEYYINGELNKSFGDDGKKLIDFGLSNANATSMLIMPDNEIIIGGYINNGISKSDFMLLEIKPKGDIDSSFGSNGLVMADFNGTDDRENSLALQTGLKIVAAGASFINDQNNSDFAMMRFNNNGTLDSAFGTNGKVLTDYEGVYNNATDVATFADKIYLSGYTADESSFSFLLASYSLNGQLDTNFGNNGFAKTSFDNGAGASYGIAIQPNDGKIILAGHSLINGSDNENVTLTRYNNNVVLPLSFLSFSATKQAQSVLLTWQTTNEINNNYFSVERSSNNENFSNINKVYSTNNLSKINMYTATDLQPLKGWNYYRLKQVDKDGKFSYSSIAAVLFTDGALISIYPNPANNFIYVDGLKEGHQSIIVINDANGKTIAKAITTSSQYKFDLQKQAAGVYYINITQDGKTIKQKFIRQ